MIGPGFEKRLQKISIMTIVQLEIMRVVYNDIDVGEVNGS
jgi:hypothetical protein